MVLYLKTKGKKLSMYFSLYNVDLPSKKTFGPLFEHIFYLYCFMFGDGSKDFSVNSPFKVEFAFKFH